MVNDEKAVLIEACCVNNLCLDILVLGCLFASDTPWHSPALELSLIGSLGLSESDTEKIRSGNAKKLLGI